MANVRKLLTKLLTDKASGLVVENHETGNITSSHVQDARLPITKTGYMPIGIVGFNANGTLSSFANVYHWKLVNRVPGSCDIRYYSRITGYSGSTNPSYTIAFHVLWAKMGGVLTNLKNAIFSKEVAA